MEGKDLPPTRRRSPAIPSAIPIRTPPAPRSIPMIKVVNILAILIIPIFLKLWLAR